MRIRELRLLRYGKFTDRLLALRLGERTPLGGGFLGLY